MTAGFRSTPLDDFLADAGSSTDTGELLQRIGLGGSMLGLIVASGLLVLLGVVHRGPRREVAMLIRATSGAGGLALVGAVVEIAGQASIDGIAWSEAFTSTSSSAAMMRVLAGLLVLLGVFDHTVPAGDAPRAATGGGIGPTECGSDGDHGPDGEQGPDDHGPGGWDADLHDPDATVRWVPVPVSAFGCVGAIVGLLSFAFDGHTVTEGPRLLHAAADVVHVSAGAVWVGGVVGLCLVAWVRRSTATSSAVLVLRFSTIAAAALIVAALFGALMTLMIVDEFSVLVDTGWGRRLILKVGVVGVAAGIGGYNRWVVIPALASAETRPAGDRRARRTLTAESLVLLAVVAVTSFLTVASPN